MNKIILTTLMLSGLALAAQPIAAYADEASEQIEESIVIDDGAAGDAEAAEESYEESSGN
ncbi:hypothetical protein Ga0123462_2256 [Mariprofundus ferrinatatus]|uniref:Uncharacterized protein n=1 Tax=Mariprofundus ferrinatatus TaxID=1921087 RepID=A0A2K8L719_9PROT|nr:hypothetical protein [Mariprofundus ferrinatatus]ATX83090.1 hypothetical protein Ga0123462_2256 [Mariprofundus ferrinatatus]